MEIKIEKMEPGEQVPEDLTATEKTLSAVASTIWTILTLALAVGALWCAVYYVWGIMRVFLFFSE